MAKTLTLEHLAERIGYTPQHISEVELGNVGASRAFLTACEAALDARGHLMPLYPAVVAAREDERQQRTEARRKARKPAASLAEDVRRRAFLGLGFAAVLLGPEAVARALSEAEAEQVAYAWSREITTAVDGRALLPALAADIKRLHDNKRVVAQLASYVASIAVTSGDTNMARRWWRRAREAATASGDSHLLAFVAARQAVQGVYGVYTPGQVLLIANDALRATSAPCTGRMHALSAKAQAHALLGHQRQARSAMHDIERAFGKLSRDVTRERVSALGWPEDRLHFAASFVGAFGGGRPAGEEAVKLYPSSRWRGHAQLRLHRAAAEIDPGDAVAMLSDLTEGQRSDRFVRQTAVRALSACDARGADVRELREILTA